MRWCTFDGHIVVVEEPHAIVMYGRITFDLFSFFSAPPLPLFFNAGAFAWNRQQKLKLKKKLTIDNKQ